MKKKMRQADNGSDEASGEDSLHNHSSNHSIVQ